MGLVIIVENLDSSQIFRKIPISVKIFEKPWFGSNFSKISILVKKNEIKLDFSRIVLKISIFEKRSINLDFGQNFLNSEFWSKFWENLDFGGNY